MSFLLTEICLNLRVAKVLHCSRQYSCFDHDNVILSNSHSFDRVEQIQSSSEGKYTGKLKSHVVVPFFFVHQRILES